jgi:DNA-binding transcriptional regulator YdaS (Cro superfamily)
VNSVVNDLAAALIRVDPQTAILLERAVRGSLALADLRQRSSQAVDMLGYPLGYFESTSGSFAEETLEQQPDTPPQLREAY